MLASTSTQSIDEILAKSLEGKSISLTEAYQLINCKDTNLIVATARLIRDQIKAGPITYSRKVFINLINLCRDTCSYCVYKKEPNDKLATMMTPEQVLAIAEVGKKYRCTEALFVTGERPEQQYLEAKKWLESLGHFSTIEYINEMSEMILQKTGLLPHTNAGSLTKKEMSELKSTNASLGMMLESSSKRLCGKGMPHEMAPSKNPKVRIKTLENAGELKIPITTGLLIGIGETHEELIDSLFLIRELHNKYGHIQEIIMQNFQPKVGTGMEKFRSPSLEYFLKTIAMARIMMPKMNIQVPPNLNPDIFGKFIDCGINDWGGISPVTIDHVNPEFAWPNIDTVENVTRGRGYNLRARLPIYPEFLYNNNGFISNDLKEYVYSLSDLSGLVREDYLN